MPIQKNLDANSPAFNIVERYWEAALKATPDVPLKITCSSYGKAVNMRQTFYRYRNLLKKYNKVTPYDDLIIRLEKIATGAFILSIMPNDHGVIRAELGDEEIKINSKNDNWKNEEIV